MKKIHLALVLVTIAALSSFYLYFASAKDVEASPNSGASVEVASGDRLSVHINSGLEVDLPPNIDMMTSQGMDRQSPGVTTFNGSVAYGVEDAVKYLVEDFGKIGIELVIGKSADSTTMSFNDGKLIVFISILPVDMGEDEELMTVIGGTISSFY
jgi:hypothetical protein